jgi:hypothetical protein
MERGDAPSAVGRKKIDLAYSIRNGEGLLQNLKKGEQQPFSIV